MRTAIAETIRPSGRITGLPWWVLVVACVGCGSLLPGGMSVIFAQEPKNAPGKTEKDDPDLTGSLSRSLSFARNREMETRLRSASSAFAAGQSVDGVRILAEILALPEPLNIQVGTAIRDVREEATRLLRQGSEELREQFHRETQVRAESDFQEALTNSDPAHLAAVAARYPFTPTAKTCVETLASQLHDHGQFEAVIQSAQRWIERSPDPVRAAEQSPQLVELWALAYKEMGLHAEAGQLAVRYSDTGETSPFRGVPSGDDALRPTHSAVDMAASWDVESELSPQALKLLRKILNDLARQGIQPAPAMRPLVIADRVVWRSLTEIVCVNRYSGEVHWRRPVFDPLINDLSKLGERNDPNLERRLQMQLGHRVLRDSILGTLTSDGERIYSIERISDLKVDSPAEPVPNNLPLPEFDPVPRVSVVAYSLANGEVQWKSHEVWEDGDHGAFLCGPPIPQGKSLYGVIQQNEKLLLLRMDAATGTLDGASLLGDVPLLKLDQRRMSQACSIVWYEGMAICATGAGAVAAFDVYAGQLRWGFRHTRDDVEIAKGLLQPPVDKNGWTWIEGWQEPQLVRFGRRLVYASPETDRIRCLSADDGELIWEVPVAGARTTVGGDDARVLVSGNRFVRSLSLQDGSIENEYAPGVPIASTAWTGSLCQLALRDGRRMEWNPMSGDARVTVSPLVGEPLLAKAGALLRIQGEAENSLVRNAPVGENQLGMRVNGISMRPMSEPLSMGRGVSRFPPGMEWTAGQSEGWLRTATEWIEGSSVDERAGRTEAVLAELARVLESETEASLPIDDWSGRWSMTPDQIRELVYRRLRRALADQDRAQSLRHLFSLLEQQPQEWETERLSARWDDSSGNGNVDAPRTVRLDAALRGVIQEIWDRSDTDQRTAVLTAYREWVTRSAEQQRDDVRALEPLAFLPPRTPERPLEWKSLGELAAHQLELRRRVALDDGPFAAAALWKLVELHMRRGEWGEAAGLIEQMQRRFGEIAVSGDQTPGELVKSFPPESPVLKRIDSDRRTAWPDREPVVVSRETILGPDTQIAIPIRAERGTLFDHVNVTYAPIGPSELRFTGLGRSKHWTILLANSHRNLRQSYPELRRGWGFGQFLVVQVGSELFCVSSLNSKGEPPSAKKQEVVLWPASVKDRPTAFVDTLGNEDNNLQSFENRLVPQVMGFIRPKSEMFNAHGHRATWVGPVSAGTLCFLQQGMLVCLETATGKELWRRYDMPPGVRTYGDNGVIVLVHDDQSNIELISPLDGRTLRLHAAPFASHEMLKDYGRLALVASGQPIAGKRFRPIDLTTPMVGKTEVADASPPELRLRMLDLAGPETRWERSFPPGSAAFEIDDDCVGVLSSDGTLSCLSVKTGEPIAERRVEIPDGLVQIATAVTERSIFVSLSSEVTEPRLLNASTVQPGWRRVFVNGPVHAFDRQSGQYQWSQRIENRTLPLDQVRDVPLLLCVDVWKGPSGPLPAEDASPPPKKGRAAQRNFEKDLPKSRYWCLDARTGKVLLDTSVESATPHYTVARDLAKGWVELRLGAVNHRFDYAPEATETK